jgi:hypothetical protein
MVLNRLFKDRRKNKKDLQGGAGLLKAIEDFPLSNLLASNQFRI